MGMWEIKVLLGVLLVYVGIVVMIYLGIIYVYDGTKYKSFTVYEARELFESAPVILYQVNPKLNLKDKLVLKNIERKIKSCRLKGERKLIISASTSPKVRAKLQYNGYKLYREGAPTDFKIFIVVEW